MSAQDTFDADHSPGTCIPTASVAPCLFVPRERLPDWVPTPFSYAMHLTGEAPFPTLDTKTVRRGKYLEPAGRLAIRDEFGIKVWRPGNGESNAHLRRFAPDIPALCYLDDVLEDDRTVAVEYKSLGQNDFQGRWDDGPPDYPLAQVHTQMTIDPTIQRVILIAIVMEWRGTIRVERFDVPREPSTCAMIADVVGNFVESIRRGELPEYDGSERSYEAWERRARPNPGTIIDLSDDDEAAKRARTWYQAHLDETAGAAAHKAQRNWFSLKLDRLGTEAGRIRITDVPEDMRVQRVGDHLTWRWVARK